MLFAYIVYLFCCITILIALIAGGIVAYTYRKQLFKSAVWARELRKMYKNAVTGKTKVEQKKEKSKPEFVDAEFRDK